MTRTRTPRCEATLAEDGAPAVQNVTERGGGGGGGGGSADGLRLDGVAEGALYLQHR